MVPPLAGRLADRVGSWWLSPLGLAIACGGLLLLSGLTQASATGYLILCLIVAAVGQGLFMSPNARALMGAAPAEEQGVASGALATTRVVGQSLSVAVGARSSRASVVRRLERLWQPDEVEPRLLRGHGILEDLRWRVLLHTRFPSQPDHNLSSPLLRHRGLLNPVRTISLSGEGEDAHAALPARQAYHHLLARHVAQERLAQW